MPKMSARLDNVKPKKRKTSTERRGSRKVAGTGRRCRKSQRLHSKAEGSSAVRSSKTADPLERLSHISCECHQLAGRRRCSASPDLQGQEGKENDLRTEQEFDSYTKNNIWNKQEPECTDCEDTSKILFPDDDSNQILPVEQFFGNLDVVQDFPQISSAPSSSVQRQKKRRHYYALEDSDDEEIALSSI
ncbi:UPF0688 protein C1orf174 homolog [Cololabis saira]|uniref:UPF0688 protein C1orf174 homolog n=1 Tax=Cololabis saira TaxID=129043 RepID=UPI002AD2A22A|nr:UPF0688 protein C1orf174 homolog [Cololabis saira]